MLIVDYTHTSSRGRTPTRRSEQYMFRNKLPQPSPPPYFGKINFVWIQKTRVKIEIGGSDVADSCTSGCFRRIASFLASEPTRAMTFIPDLNAILTASSDPTTTTYKRYSSSEVLSLSPKYGPASGSSTLITITGTGFPVNSTAACRFGHSNVSGSDYPIDGWVSANVVS